MRHFALLFGFAAIVLTAQPAAAATVAPRLQASKQSCFIYSKTMSTDSRVALANSGLQPCGIGADIDKYIGFRVEPMTLSDTPIHHGNQCYFVGNNSKASLFVPSGSDAEFSAFLAAARGNRSGAGLTVIPCAQATPIKQSDLCMVGKAFTASFSTFGDGFSALNEAPANGASRNLSVYDQTGKLLRTLTVQATPGNWTVTAKGDCANLTTAGGTTTPMAKPTFNRNASATPAAAVAPVVTGSVAVAPAKVAAAAVAAAPAFNRTATTTTPATDTRAYITDGATVRHIPG